MIEEVIEVVEVAADLETVFDRAYRAVRRVELATEAAEQTGRLDVPAVAEPVKLERMLAEARVRGEVDFGRDILPRVCAQDRVYAYDFAENRVPGLAEYEERAYWRDVGTLAALAAAQQDATGTRPRFNLWNPRWPIHGRVQELEEEAAEVTPVWRAAHRDRRTDERVQTS